MFNIIKEKGIWCICSEVTGIKDKEILKSNKYVVKLGVECDIECLDLFFSIIYIKKVSI